MEYVRGLECREHKREYSISLAGFERSSNPWEETSLNNGKDRDKYGGSSENRNIENN